MEASSGQGPRATSAGGGEPRRLARRRVFVASAAVVVLAVSAAGIYLLSDDDGGERACLVEAASHVLSADGLNRGNSDDPSLLWGAHLERARAAGFDDSSLHNLTNLGSDTGSIGTGVLPDPLHYPAVSRIDLDSAPPEVAGYDSSQVSCWFGHSFSGDEPFAAVGDFEEESVASSELGRASEIAASGHLLVSDPGRDAAPLLDAEAPVDDTLDMLLNTLDDHDAISFFVLNLDEPDMPTVAWGHAPGSDGEQDLLVFWLFPDESAAQRGQGTIAAMFEEDDSDVDRFIEGDPVEHLVQEGSMIQLRVRMPSGTIGHGWVSPSMDPAPVLEPGDH